MKPSSKGRRWHIPKRADRINCRTLLYPEVLFGDPDRGEVEPYLFGDYTLEQSTRETTVVIRVTSDQ